MFTSNEKKQLVTINVTISYKLSQWLRMDLEDLGLIFGFSIRLHNTLRAIGLRELKELLLFTRKGLTTGTGMTQMEFDELSHDDQYRIIDLEQSRNKELVEPKKPWHSKLGPASMIEIDAMLEKLNLKLKGE